MKKGFITALILCFVLTFGSGSIANADEPLKIGVLRLTSSAPIFIALEKGFFTQEGLDIQAVYFKSAQPVALALASGDIQIGATGLTAGLYNAMAKGLDATIVADKGRLWPGYQLVGLMVSKKAWENGIRSLKDLKGKRVGVTQIGSTFHYILGNILPMEGLSLKDVKITPLGGVKNMMDSVSSDRIESAFMVQPFCTVMEAKGMGRRILWVSDYMKYQIAGIFFGPEVMKDQKKAISFLKAYIRACRYYYENCLKKSGGRFIRGRHFDEIIGYISKYTGRKPELISKGLNYNHPDGMLDVSDIKKQVTWYIENHLISQAPDLNKIVDTTLWKKAFDELKKAQSQ